MFFLSWMIIITTATIQLRQLFTLKTHWSRCKLTASLRRRNLQFRRNKIAMNVVINQVICAGVRHCCSAVMINVRWKLRSQRAALPRHGQPFPHAPCCTAPVNRSFCAFINAALLIGVCPYLAQFISHAFMILFIRIFAGEKWMVLEGREGGIMCHISCKMHRRLECCVPHGEKTSPFERCKITGNKKNRFFTSKTFSSLCV